jgi:hypothetical protein
MASPGPASNGPAAARRAGRGGPACWRRPTRGQRLRGSPRAALGPGRPVACALPRGCCTSAPPPCCKHAHTGPCTDARASGGVAAPPPSARRGRNRSRRRPGPAARLAGGTRGAVEVGEEERRATVGMAGQRSPQGPRVRRRLRAADGDGLSRTPRPVGALWEHPVVHGWRGRLRAAEGSRAPPGGQRPDAEERKPAQQVTDAEQAVGASHARLCHNDDDARCGERPLHKARRVGLSQSKTGSTPLEHLRIAEPQRRQEMQRRCGGATVCHGDVNQDIVRRRLGILDIHIEVGVGIKDAGIKQLKLGA